MVGLFTEKVKSGEKSSFGVPQLPESILIKEIDIEKYLTALDFEIKIVCYSSEDIWGSHDQQRCQVFFRSGRNIKRIVGLLLCKGRLTGDGVTCKDLVRIAASSRSTIHLILKEIVLEGWADKVRFGTQSRYYAEENMFSYWKERYDNIFENYNEHSEWPKFLMKYFNNNPFHLKLIKPKL